MLHKRVIFSLIESPRKYKKYSVFKLYDKNYNKEGQLFFNMTIFLQLKRRSEYVGKCSNDHQINPGNWTDSDYWIFENEKAVYPIN